MKLIAMPILSLLTAVGAVIAQPPPVQPSPKPAAEADDSVGGNALSQNIRCVPRALNWFQKNQNTDGSWGDANKGAMTGFVLLSFLSHGETPDSPAYGQSVTKAVNWIIEKGAKFDGRLNMAKQFNGPAAYEHGICTYALGEYYVMTQDDRVLPLLKQALGYIVEGQNEGGGWRYTYDKAAGDLCVSGWQIQALWSAQNAKLDIPGLDAAFDRAMKFVESVKGPSGGYGYQEPGDRYGLTGVGIYCRLLGKTGRTELRNGMTWLLDETEKNKPVKYNGEAADLYSWYFHTSACLMYGGSAWQKWNRWFQDEIVNAQSADGSWPVPGAKGYGPQSDPGKTGQIYRTALCTLMVPHLGRRMPILQQ